MIRHEPPNGDLSPIGKIAWYLYLVSNNTYRVRLLNPLSWIGMIIVIPILIVVYAGIGIFELIKESSFDKFCLWYDDDDNKEEMM